MTREGATATCSMARGRQRQRGSLGAVRLATTVMLVALCGLLPAPCHTKDPVFSINATVPFAVVRFRNGSTSFVSASATGPSATSAGSSASSGTRRCFVGEAVYRLNNIQWSQFLRTCTTNGGGSDPGATAVNERVLYVFMNRLPKWFNGVRLNTAGARAVAREAILGHAVEIVTYFAKLIAPPGCKVRVVSDGSVDRVGTLLVLTDEQRLPDEVTQHRFNATLEVDFRAKPYGQSHANRFVSNEELKWTDAIGHKDAAAAVSPGSDSEAQLLAPAANDLVYRLYHNLAHSFGMGHLLAITPAPKDDSCARADLRSVGFANFSDGRLAASRPTRLDEFAYAFMARNRGRIMAEFVDHILAHELPRNMVDLLDTTRYFV